MSHLHTLIGRSISSRASRTAKFRVAAFLIAVGGVAVAGPSHAQTELPFQIDTPYTIVPGDPSVVPVTDTYITPSGQLINQDVLTNDYTISNLGSLIDNQGTLTNHNGLENLGTIDNSGTFTNDLIAQLTNDGVINNQAGGQLNILESAMLQNSATINNEVGGTLFLDHGVYSYNWGVINNHGDLDGGGYLMNITGGTLVNSATGTVASSVPWMSSLELENQGLVDNDGSFTVGNNSSNEALGTIENSGNFMAGTVDDYGTLFNRGTFNNQLNGSLNVGGLFYNEGQLISDGDTAIDYTGQFHNVGGSVVNNGYFWNFSGVFNNSGTFTNNDRVYLEWGPTENTGVIVNNSSFEIQTIFTNDNGTIINNGLLTISHPHTLGGLITGAGTMLNSSGGDVVLSGILAPGNSTGTQSLDGDFTLDTNASLDIELASPSDHDMINVEGTSLLTVDGNVRAIFSGGMTAGDVTIGDYFDIVTADGVDSWLIGRFLGIDDTNATLEGGLIWSILYGDDDGGWSSVADPQSQSYSIVRLMAVPEPGTGILVAIGLLLLEAKRRRGTHDC